MLLWWIACLLSNTYSNCEWILMINCTFTRMSISVIYWPIFNWLYTWSKKNNNISFYYSKSHPVIKRKMDVLRVEHLLHSLKSHRFISSRLDFVILFQFFLLYIFSNSTHRSSHWKIARKKMTASKEATAMQLTTHFLSRCSFSFFFKLS